MFGVLGSILGWINPLSSVLGKLEDWGAKLVDAKTEQERIAANENIALLRAQVDGLKAVAMYRVTVLIQALFAGPYIVYEWKVILWDKLITHGAGSTDDLSPHFWYVFLLVAGFYFAHLTVKEFK